jgi:predicted GNAT family acetyltransferase
MINNLAFENDPSAFVRKCGPLLGQNEVQHNLLLSACQDASEKIAQKENIKLRGVALMGEGETLLAAAMQTPPHYLMLSAANQPVFDELAATLHENKFSFPGVVGPSDAASSFAQSWTALTGQNFTEYMDQIVYSLRKVVMPAPVNGKFRFADESEIPLLSGWFKTFSQQVMPKAEHMTEEEAQRKAAQAVRAGRVAVWDVEGKPVAQAAVSGTKEVPRISAVYTPPESRGHGYASAVVAHLSQHLLDRGCRICCLYADARNPVSNSIYRKIGYEFAGRSSLYVLKKP